MRILVINPNTTALDDAKRSAPRRRQRPPPAPTIVAVNPAFGPPSIEGYYDEVFVDSGPASAQMRAAPEADAYVIACFDDTGLDAARCLTDRAGDRHRRSGVPHGKPRRRQASAS